MTSKLHNLVSTAPVGSLLFFIPEDGEEYFTIYKAENEYVEVSTEPTRFKSVDDLIQCLSIWNHTKSKYDISVEVLGFNGKTDNNEYVGVISNVDLGDE